MKKEIDKRIAELQAKLIKDAKYLRADIKEEIEDDIEFLLKLQHALYFY